MCVIEEVLETKIKNLEPVFYQTLFNRYSNDDYVKTLNKGKLLSYIRDDIGISKLKNGVSVTSIDYYTVRGWNSETAKMMAHNYYVNNIKHKQKGSPYSKSTYLNKINPNTQEIYTNDEIDYKIKSMRPNSIEYYLNKGYDLETAKQKRTEFQYIGNSKSVEKHKNADVCDWNSTTLEYYLNKGYDLETSKIMRKNRQNNISLKSRIKQYGFREGILLYLKQSRKIKTRLLKDYDSYDKSIRYVKIKRESLLKTYIQTKNSNITINEFLMLYDTNLKILKGNYKGHASYESLIYFKPLYIISKEHDIDIRLGYNGDVEFKIFYSNKNYYRYDCVFYDYKLIFEYDSVYYHNNTIKKDLHKEQIANDNGFKVIRLCASKSKTELCDIIIKELNQYNFPTHNLLKHKPYFRIKECIND